MGEGRKRRGEGGERQGEAERGQDRAELHDGLQTAKRASGGRPGRGRAGASGGRAADRVRAPARAAGEPSEERPRRRGRPRARGSRPDQGRQAGGAMRPGRAGGVVMIGADVPEPPPHRQEGGEARIRRAPAMRRPRREGEGEKAGQQEPKQDGAHVPGFSAAPRPRTARPARRRKGRARLGSSGPWGRRPGRATRQSTARRRACAWPAERLFRPAAAERLRWIFGVPAGDPSHPDGGCGGQARRPGARKDPWGRPVRTSGQSVRKFGDGALSWNVGKGFSADSDGQCRTFGVQVTSKDRRTEPGSNFQAVSERPRRNPLARPPDLFTRLDAGLRMQNISYEINILPPFSCLKSKPLPKRRGWRKRLSQRSL